jgi:hypothetical protein
MPRLALTDSRARRAGALVHDCEATVFIEGRLIVHNSKLILLAMPVFIWKRLPTYWNC